MKTTTEIPQVETLTEQIAGHHVELRMLLTTNRAYVELFVDEKFIESVTMRIEFAAEFKQTGRPVANFAIFLLRNRVLKKEEQKSAEIWRVKLDELGIKE